MSCPAPSPTGVLALEPGQADRSLVTTFLANVPDFVHFKDAEGRFIAVSRSKLVRNGLSHENEIIGKTDFDFFSAEDARRAQQDEAEIMRTGDPLVGKLEQLRWADGRETWSLINKLPLRDEYGKIIGTFGISQDVSASKRMEMALEQSRRELIDASRMAGMAEVATGVLHNVGNVLTSLNVSTSLLSSGLRQSKIGSLAKIATLLREHASDLGTYITQDERGRLVPSFIESLARHFSEDRDRLLQEIKALQSNVDHIKEIVNMQQAYATMTGVREPLTATTLMEDALRISAPALQRGGISVVREFKAVPPLLGERGKILQVLINFLHNARQAIQESGRSDKILTARLQTAATGNVQLAVQDNGIGIPSENLGRIFQHGFTTKTEGHGFGLHSSANAAREMKGTILVHSEGTGTGATFILELPAAISAVAAG